MKHHYSINNYEMGLGKSAIASVVMSNLDSIAVVVCPSILKETWVEELSKFTSLKPYVVNTGKEATNIHNIWADVFICSFDIFQKINPQHLGASVVVIDECHNIKNPDARRTRAIDKYIRENLPDTVIMLSGTPIKNRVVDLWQLLKICSYNKKNTSGKSIMDKYPTYYKFGKQFCHSSFNGYETTFLGFKKDTWAELQTYLVNKILTKRVADCLTLPELIPKEVYLPSKFDDRQLQGVFKLNAKVGEDSTGARLKKESAIAKAPLTAKYIRELLDEGNEHIVVFSDHPDVLDIIAKEVKVSYCIVTGETPIKKRDEYRKAFQNKEISLFLATIGACSVGVTLTASNNVVFNDLSWTPADNAQAKKRIHRIGQSKNCIIHIIVGTDIDKSITKSLSEKERDIQLILGDRK